jgi:4-hydroxybenzoate polyprenyltransferase
MAAGIKSSQYLVIREASLLYAFTRRDWTTAVLPGMIFALPALKQVHDHYQSPIPLTVPLVTLVTWLTLYLYSFNLSNQIASIEEDRLNKPDRPLCTGLATAQETKVRYMLASILFLALGLVRPLLLTPTLVWILAAIFLSFTSYGSHWIGKNIIGMTIGTWSLLVGAWRTIGPTTPEIDRQIFYISMWSGLLTQIQDLRDIKGDIAVGRRTLPIAFGDESSRWLIVLAFGPVGLLLLLKGGFIDAPPFSALLVAIHFVLAYRILKASGRGDAKYDHITYKVRVPIFFV